MIVAQHQLPLLIGFRAAGKPRRIAGTEKSADFMQCLFAGHPLAAKPATNHGAGAANATAAVQIHTIASVEQFVDAVDGLPHAALIRGRKILNCKTAILGRIMGEPG